ncbi:MAG: TGS domain-containing protein [Candidatus Peribacteria bacterium]|nr:TGS domain-containing protein [Candidatus Peribacteria bacterium]
MYTPKGDIKELPQGSSILDFAFSIHSNIGLRFKNAIVNGQIKPLSYILGTGDIVHINTFKNKYSAVKHWIDYLHTPSAKSQLIKYIRMQERENRLEESIDGLNAYLKQL